MKGVAVPVHDHAASGLRVVIADAHHLARRGLAEIMRSAGAVVVADPATAEATLRGLPEWRPQVLVVTLELARAERGHLISLARERWPDMGVVALSERPSDQALSLALQLGASAYLPKTADPDRFVTAVLQSAAAPGAFVADDVLAAGGRHARTRGPHLTARETEVLVLAAEGLTVREISARLFVSDATTKSHLLGIYRKLGVGSRAQAVLAASRQGLLPS